MPFNLHVHCHFPPPGSECFASNDLHIWCSSEEEKGSAPLEDCPFCSDRQSIPGRSYSCSILTDKGLWEASFLAWRQYKLRCHSCYRTLWGAVWGWLCLRAYLTWVPFLPWSASSTPPWSPLGELTKSLHMNLCLSLQRTQLKTVAYLGCQLEPLWNKTLCPFCVTCNHPLFF